MVSITPAPARQKKVVTTLLTERGLEYKEPPKEVDIFEEAEPLFNLKVIWGNADAYDEAFMWTQDFLGKWQNLKSKEIFKISRRSAEWSYTTQKEQQRMGAAEGLMKAISELSKSLISMYQEQAKIKQFLAYYKEESDERKKSENEINLKGIWVDYVDAPKPASIVQLERNYEYITLRDLIYACKTTEDIEKSPVSERLKAVAMRKLKDYEDWKKNWKENLKKSQAIIDERIKSFENTIKMYKDWVKPMLRDVNFFRMRGMGDYEKEEWLDPGLVELGNWISVTSELDFWKGIKYKDAKEIASKYEVRKSSGIIDKYKKNPPKEEKERTELEEAQKKMASAEEELAKKCDYKYWVPVIKFIFGKSAAAAPDNPKEGGVLVLGNAFVYPARVFLTEFTKWTKDPAEEWIKGVVMEVEEAKKEAEKAGKKEKEMSLIDSFNDMFKGVESVFESLKKGFSSISNLFAEKSSPKAYESRRKRDKAVADTLDNVQSYYDKFKKSHGMMTWDDRTFKSEGVLPPKVIIKK